MKLFGLKKEIDINKPDDGFTVDLSQMRFDGNGQFSSKNANLMKKYIKEIQPHCYMEIGVAKFDCYEKSSTETYITNKPEGAYYFGIDINMDKKGSYRNKGSNVFLLGHDTKDKQKILDDIKNIDETLTGQFIDILFIDGDHSILGAFSDWKFAENVRVGGYILVHDSNFHIGPIELFDAIDETYFEKTKYFENENDLGIFVCKRLR